MDHLFSITIDRVAFYLPFFQIPVYYYGVLFGLGVFISYRLFFTFLWDRLSSTSIEKESFRKQVDQYSMVLALSGLIGARLGHVFFYDWIYYQDDLISILYLRDGGLASHGGIFLSLLVSYFWWKRKLWRISYLALHDLLLLSLLPLASFIRLGNLLNQEIIGIPASGILSAYFAHPLDGSPPGSYYPVQLYESILYFSIFLLLLYLKRYLFSNRPGIIMSLVLVSSFVGRIALESIKGHQGSSSIEIFDLSPGAILSIPFIAFAVSALIYAYIPREPKA
jgi:prolipoprotein diacylglyceryl transferase